jgi:DNA-binding LytR/AlgR family response regulator
MPEKAPVSVDFDEIRRMLGAPTKEFRKRFTVKIGQHLKVIGADEVECFYSENKGTYIHTFGNRDYLIEPTLEVLEKELDPAVFFRVSRKFIVPLKAVAEIVLYSNSRLKVILPSYNADEVIVSREKVAGFKSWLD